MNIIKVFVVYQKLHGNNNIPLSSELRFNLGKVGVFILSNIIYLFMMIPLAFIHVK
jgi:hypothetical protein